MEPDYTAAASDARQFLRGLRGLETITGLLEDVSAAQLRHSELTASNQALAAECDRQRVVVVDAQRDLADARAQAEHILGDAYRQAASIIADGKQQAEEARKAADAYRDQSFEAATQAVAQANLQVDATTAQRNALQAEIDALQDKLAQLKAHAASLLG